MRVIDERYRLLAGSSLLGDEVIRLSKVEEQRLGSALLVIEEFRALRTAEYLRRGLAESADLASDVADGSDDNLLASAEASLSELIESGRGRGQTLAYVLPVDIGGAE